MSVSDVPNVPPCPVQKRGAHHFSAIIPGTDDGYMTLFCDACAWVRRMPVSGSLYVGTLDGKSAAEIRKLVSG